MSDNYDLNSMRKDINYIENILTGFDILEEALERGRADGSTVEDQYFMSSVYYAFNQIGEPLKAGKISAELREYFSEIDWKRLSSLRNLASHSPYDDIDPGRALRSARSVLNDIYPQIIELHSHLTQQYRKQRGE